MAALRAQEKVEGGRARGTLRTAVRPLCRLCHLSIVLLVSRGHPTLQGFCGSGRREGTCLLSGIGPELRRMCSCPKPWSMLGGGLRGLYLPNSLEKATASVLRLCWTLPVRGAGALPNVRLFCFPISQMGQVISNLSLGLSQS